MLIFDAIIAGLIFKLFGEQGAWVLIITCCVAFLRMSGTVTGIFNSVVESLIEIEDEEEK